MAIEWPALEGLINGGQKVTTGPIACHKTARPEQIGLPHQSRVGHVRGEYHTRIRRLLGDSISRMPHGLGSVIRRQNQNTYLLFSRQP